jgi:hypothetical protein
MQSVSEHKRRDDLEKLCLDNSNVASALTNVGWNKRIQYCVNSEPVESFGKLNLPLFNGSRYVVGYACII